MSIDDALPEDWNKPYIHNLIHPTLEQVQAARQAMAEIDDLFVDQEVAEMTQPNSAIVMFYGALRDMQPVIDLGGKKYGYGSYLDVDNVSMEHRANCASICRHVAHHLVHPDVLDEESGVDHMLHAAFRLLAAYQRKLKFGAP